MASIWPPYGRRHPNRVRHHPEVGEFREVSQWLRGIPRSGGRCCKFSLFAMCS